MATEPQLTKKDLSVPDMGITFNAIRSDEPHQAIDERKTEVEEPYVPGLGTRIGNRENVFDVGKAYNDEQNDVGMIVSDKKQSRGFVDSVSAAFHEWWGGTKKTLVTPIIPPSTKPQRPEHVQKAETRAEVIKNAIRTDAVAPKDDHQIVIEKIRTFKQDVARATGTQVVVKDTPKESVGWTHTLADDGSSAKKEERVIQSIPPSDLRNATIAPVVEQRSETKVTTIPKAIPPSTRPTSVTLQSQVGEHVAQIAVPETLMKKATPIIAKTITAAPEITKGSVMIEKENAHTPHTASAVPYASPRPPTPPFFQKKSRPSATDPHVSISAIPMTMPTSVPERARIPVALPKVAQPAQPNIPFEPIPVPNVITPAPIVPRSPSAPQITQRPALPRVSPTPPEKEPTRVSQRNLLEQTPKEVSPLQKIPVLEPVKPRIEAVESVSTPSPSLPEKTAPIIEAPVFHTSERKTPASVSQPVQTKSIEKVAPAKSNSTASITRWIILGVVALVGVLLAVVASIYVTQNTDREPGIDTAPETTVPLIIPKLFAVDAQVPLPLGTDKNAFLNMLYGKVSTAQNDIVQFYPTQQSGTTQYPASSKEILALLSLSLNQKAQRSLEDTLMLGSIKTTVYEPYIIIQSYNFDLLFSGMLSWEKNLYADFVPLFGSSDVALNTFTDAIIRNKSVRILSDTSGKSVLLYSFINQNTVVITTSTDSLTKIIEKFQAEDTEGGK